MHYGEEHWNDADGATLFPKVVEESGRYKPAFVTTSGDKDNDGTVEQLSRWKQILSPYDRLGVPFLPAWATTTARPRPARRPAPPACSPPACRAPGQLQAGVRGPAVPVRRRRPVQGRRLRARAPPTIPPAPPRTTSSNGTVRVIFLDNSCWGLADCDPSQNPAFPDAQGNRSQLDYLRKNAGDASRAGKQVFVVMHMPTRDPRDQSYIDPTTFNHVMGKGLSPTGAPDNMRFEEAAEQPAWTACWSATSRASSCTRAAAACRTTSTAAPAASCTPTAR